jgi:ubiquinone/menaquinone biosynthesis C-methylase UbiE
MKPSEVAAPRTLEPFSRVRRLLRAAARSYALTPYQKYVSTPANIRKNAAKPVRKLEIGPGRNRIEHFETLNVVGGREVDYVVDAAGPLPFGDDTFDVIYASHVLEHIPWYRTSRVLSEWTRVLKRGGWLEIWIPDGLKIARAFVAAEEIGSTEFYQDDWWRSNEHRDPTLWMSGRCYSYGDGTSKLAHQNWHRALFSERLLKEFFAEAGLTEISAMTPDCVRGYGHGWINLGVKGQKP